MTKKIARILALGLCTVALISCGGKGKSSEPKPNPDPINPTPNPNPNSGTTTPPSEAGPGVKITLASGETTFTIESISGSEIKIEGVQGVSSLTPFAKGASRSFTASSAGGLVVVRGNITSIAFSSGKFAKLDISEIKDGLKTLTVNARVSSINLSAAKDLETLQLGMGTNSGTLDLTHMTSLRIAYFNESGGYVKLPSSVEKLRLDNTGSQTELTLVNFPKLKELFLGGGSPLTDKIDLSGSLVFEDLTMRQTFVTTLRLNNCTKLHTVKMASTHVQGKNGDWELRNCPNLTNGDKSKGFIAHKHNNPSALDGIVKLNLEGSAFTNIDGSIIEQAPQLEEINLRNNKLTKADFSIFTGLNKLDLMGNNTLTGEALDKALKTLKSATNGELKIEKSKLNNEQTTALQAKGWKIVD